MIVENLLHFDATLRSCKELRSYCEQRDRQIGLVILRFNIASTIFHSNCSLDAGDKRSLKELNHCTIFLTDEQAQGLIPIYIQPNERGCKYTNLHNNERMSHTSRTRNTLPG